MKRAMIVPAAGRGSRLGSKLPKLLYPVAGRPMLDHLVDLYRDVVEAWVLVLHPDFEAPVRDHVRALGLSPRIAFQPEPTGMLDAILIAGEPWRGQQPQQVWITWCDQVAVRPETVQRLAARAEAEPKPLLTFPTGLCDEPYIHFERDASGRIVRVLQRREGDAMPRRGESDSGLFCLSAAAYFESLPQWSASTATEGGAHTGERNFLPFIPWLAARGEVATFPVTHRVEQVGVNDASDLRRVEEFLRG